MKESGRARRARAELRESLLSTEREHSAGSPDDEPQRLLRELPPLVLERLPADQGLRLTKTVLVYNKQNRKNVFKT